MKYLATSGTGWGTRLRDSKVLVLLFLLVAVVFALTAKGTLGVSDSLLSLRTAQAIVGRGALSLESSEPDIVGVYSLTHDDRTYSKYGIGLPLLWVPEVLVARAVAARTRLSAELVARFLISFYNVVFGAVACAVMFCLTRHLGASTRRAVGVALILGLGTIAWRYSVWTFSEATQMCLLLAAVYGVARNSGCSISLGGACLGYLILIKVFSVVYLPAFAVYVLVKNWPPGSPLPNRAALARLGRLLALPVLACIGLLVLDYVRFGDPLETGYGAEVARFGATGLLANAFRLLFSQDVGLFVYCPVLILGALGYPGLLRAARSEALFFLGLIATNLGVMALWYAHGCLWAWGPRFLVPTLPLYLVPLAQFSWGRVPRAATVTIAVALVVASFGIQVIGVLENNFEYVHIRENLVARETRSAMPSVLIGTAVLLKHKLLAGDNVYALSEFGMTSDQVVDTSSDESMVGLNLWYQYLARFLGKPWLRIIPIAFLPVIALLALGLARALGLVPSLAHHPHLRDHDRHSQLLRGA